MKTIGQLTAAAKQLRLERRIQICRQPRSAKERRYGSGSRSDILLSIECMGDHAATNAATCVEAVKHLSSHGIQSEKVIVEIAGEENPAGGRGDAGDEGSR
jgi:hypothetical protein